MKTTLPALWSRSLAPSLLAAFTFAVFGPAVSAQQAMTTTSFEDVWMVTWALFTASGGTYEVNGNTLITHNVVTKQ